MCVMGHPSRLNVVRLEGDEISMNLIMAPLWVVNGFLIVVPVWFAIATGCRRLRGGEPVDGVQVGWMPYRDGPGDDGHWSFAVVLIWDWSIF